MLAPSIFPFPSIAYRPAIQMVEVCWSGPCSGLLLRQVYHQVTELVEQTGASRILFDHRARARIQLADARWVASEAYPRLLVSRMLRLRLAYVVPESFFVTYGAGASETLGEVLHVALFLDLPEAVEWLLTE